MYDKLLLTTDGSEESEKAVEHAKSLAEKYGAEVHILYISDVRSQMGDPSMEFLLENLEEIGEEAVNEVAKMFPDSIDTVLENRPGVPHTEITDYIQEEDIDILCMATHGRSGLDRLLIGSTTEKVLRESPVPVITVPLEQD
jgi:nucleotide-binding universal stress UspA family protein